MCGVAEHAASAVSELVWGRSNSLIGADSCCTSLAAHSGGSAALRRRADNSLSVPVWVSERGGGRISVIAPLNDCYSGGCCYRPVIWSPLHLSPRCRGGTCKPQRCSQTPLIGFPHRGKKGWKGEWPQKEMKKETRGAASARRPFILHKAAARQAGSNTNQLKSKKSNNREKMFRRQLRGDDGNATRTISCQCEKKRGKQRI